MRFRAKDSRKAVLHRRWASPCETRLGRKGFCLYNDVAFSRDLPPGELRPGTNPDPRHGRPRRKRDRRIFLRRPAGPFHRCPPGSSHHLPGNRIHFPMRGRKGPRIYGQLPDAPARRGRILRLVFEEAILPLAHEFQPQIIIRNGGSDPHFEDSLTNLGLTLKGFRLIGEKVREMSDVCGGKGIDMIGSGYNKEILPHAWLSLIAGLADLNISLAEPTRSRISYKKIHRMRKPKRC